MKHSTTQDKLWHLDKDLETDHFFSPENCSYYLWGAFLRK